MFQEHEIKKYRRKAYTLIEIMISIMFFSIIAVSITLPFTKSISLSVKDQDIIDANNLARSYLRETELLWKQPLQFEQETLPVVDSKYTDNSRFSVVPDPVLDIATNSSGIVVLKRVRIKYQNSRGDYLADLYLDINKP